MRIVGKLSVVSGATLLSRILGLVRDILFFSIFGTSILGEAFLLAFTFPNLFRRMLGEGTLTSALIPTYTSCIQKKGQARALSLLNQVFTRLLCFLGILALVVVVVSLLFSFSGIYEKPKWTLGALYNSITFGYVILICASAILVGVLNVHENFFEGAISPVLLNACMIGALCLSFSSYMVDRHAVALALCGSVILAGTFQLSLPWFRLRKKLSWHWRPTLAQSEELTALSKLFWVGALGAAVAQINILVSRVFAYSLSEEGSLAFLYIAARLVELPLGLFAIAISTVIFPLLSKASASEDKVDFQNHFFKGLRMIVAITLPASVGLCLLAEPVLQLLFEWQEFERENVVRGAMVLQVAAWTIPAYAVSQYLVKVHHSRKNMKIPLRAAVVSLLTNAALSLFLMNMFGVIGLAWANLISSLLQVIILMTDLSFLGILSCLDRDKIALNLSLSASFIMASFVYFADEFLANYTSKLSTMVSVSLTILCAAALYFLLLSIMKFPETKGIVKRVR